MLTLTLKTRISFFIEKKKKERKINENVFVMLLKKRFHGKRTILVDMYKRVYLHPGDHSIEKEQDDDITEKGNNTSRSSLQMYTCNVNHVLLYFVSKGTKLVTYGIWTDNYGRGSSELPLNKTYSMNNTYFNWCTIYIIYIAFIWIKDETFSQKYDQSPIRDENFKNIQNLISFNYLYLL